MDHATDDFIETLSRARDGDERAFASIVDEHRVKLFRHCYRMLGSGPEAEEAVQDTFLKAWQRLSTFEARGSFPGWLYRIATNICIDRLRGRSARSHPVSYGPAAVPGSLPVPASSTIDWVEPVANLSGSGPTDPEQSVLQRERISLAFVAALQRLSARQRAALLLHDVLDFTHDEVAEVLDASPSAVNSLLYRARQTIATPPTVDLADPSSAEVMALVERYVRAWELADISQFLATVSDDVRFSMPPETMWFKGAELVAAFVESFIFEPAQPHGVAVRVGRANAQPAVATYEPGPDGDLVVNGLQILDIDRGSGDIVAITSFRDPNIAIRCGLPATISAPNTN